MNTEHKDINKIIPFGDQIKGFLNQKFISPSDLSRILRERGIFTFNVDKDYNVPIYQTLLLSPTEFDKIRYAFNTKEDNPKTISKDIYFASEEEIFKSEIAPVDVKEFIKKKLPTCSLRHPIKFKPVNGNNNHIIAEFEVERTDINKLWYEQTNIFTGSVEFINDKGKGRVVIKHTAEETKELSAFITTAQVKKFKEKNIIPAKEKLKEIIFEDFLNEDRFVFFYRLTNHLESDYFHCENIKDVSIKPEDMVLPEEIKWMEKMQRIILTGEALDKKYFMKESKFHKDLILWSIDAAYTFNFNGEKGRMTVSMGFPDYYSKLGKSEFEINISSLSPETKLDTKTRRTLKMKLLSEMDRLKSVVYNNYLEYKQKQ